MGKKQKKDKIGRNSSCPCGSGKKHKKCRGFIQPNPIHPPVISQHELQLKVAEMNAKIAQQQKQQGLGRPIISTLFKDIRFVAVGDRLYHSPDWKTFHDFLFVYIKDVLGKEWGQAELLKTFEERHPILQWAELITKHKESNSQNAGIIRQAAMTGAVAAFLGLAYNIYLLAHNITIQSSLIHRLKDPNQFNGAYYETYVAATFIKAGFDLEFENEADISTTHCEFTATSRLTGKKYSVEAKAREPHKTDANVGNQLYEALRMKANHQRIVFIDVNVPEDSRKGESLKWVGEAMQTLRKKESSMTIQGEPAPSGYIVLTNHPYVYNLENSDFHRAVIAEGFKIPEFGHRVQFPSVRAAREARDRHSDMFSLMDSIITHYEIPSTFDGEIPEFAFGDVSNRLTIGQLYQIPDKGGTEVVGQLVDAIVIENEHLAYGTYKLDDGRQVIVTNPLTEEEIRAYQRHPDTFFGVLREDGKQIDDPLELYDFVYKVYRRTSKEKLLEFMNGHPEMERLKAMPQEELAVIYCEWIVEHMLSGRAAADAQRAGEQRKQ